MPIMINDKLTNVLKIGCNTQHLIEKNQLLSCLVINLVLRINYVSYIIYLFILYNIFYAFDQNLVSSESSFFLRK